MKKILVALSLLATSLAASAENWKVTPGVGVGPIKLGQQYLEANKFLTPGDSVGNAKQAYLRYKEGVELECENFKIIQIVLRQSSFSTKSGPVAVAMDGDLRIGSGVAQMETALGRNYQARDLKVGSGQPQETYYAYQSRGLGVLARGGRIVEFAIWPKK